MATFEIGQTYMTSSFGDHTQIHRITVVSRTVKTVTLSGYIEGRRKIYEYDGDECVRAGNYRLAPIFCASEVA